MPIISETGFVFGTGQTLWPSYPTLGSVRPYLKVRVKSGPDTNNSLYITHTCTDTNTCMQKKCRHYKSTADIYISCFPINSAYSLLFTFHIGRMWLNIYSLYICWCFYRNVVTVIFLFKKCITCSAIFSIYNVRKYVNTSAFITFDQIALMFSNLVMFLILQVLLSIYFVFPCWCHKPHDN